MQNLQAEIWNVIKKHSYLQWPTMVDNHDNIANLQMQRKKQQLHITKKS